MVMTCCIDIIVAADAMVPQITMASVHNEVFSTTNSELTGVIFIGQFFE